MMLNKEMLHKANRLANEKSPYLLQHAYNPVDWYPWGDEAFAKAKAEDKPIFLSIGYSTCHWCHVMAHESFEDTEVADIINGNYIAIKVDREERPDIDHIYMEVCQTLTGQGGWPLTIFMTAEKKPFFAGTYFPKKDMRGMQGLVSILTSITEYWKYKRNELIESSEKIVEAVREGQNYERAEELDEQVLHDAFKMYRQSFDGMFGGFNRAPKFPTPHNLYFLLRYWKLYGNETALAMVRKTLDSMYRGGVYDHIGYGFCRYSTDEKWLVPHFEKMLYDNALLAIAYTEVYQATKSDEYKQIVQQIISYVLRDMKSPEGAFYSAEDADSEGTEGKFYVFSRDEVMKVLGEQDGEKYSEYYDITDGGNFEGENILNLIESTVPKEDKEFCESCRQKLFKYREERVHPGKDTKILTAWNSMMLAALAYAGRALNNNDYIYAAECAYEFIENNLMREDKRLYTRFKDGEAAYEAYAADYAYLIWSLLELYQTTFKTKYLQQAVIFTEEVIKYFWDNDKGGFFIYGNDAEELLLRPKEIYDGAVPSGNSVMVNNLIKLSRITGRYDYEEKAREILKLFSNDIKKYPMAYAFSLCGLASLQKEAVEVVIAVPGKSRYCEDIRERISQNFIPFTNILYKFENDNEVESIVPAVVNYKFIDEKPTVYICKNNVCMEPITDFNSFFNVN